MALMAINTLILVPVIFSMGMFFQQTREIQMDLIRLKRFKENQSKIFHYVLNHCFQWIEQYLEFEIFEKIDVCANFDLSLKMGKVALLLSTLFNTCVPYGLYGPPLLPVIITGTTSSIIFYTNFTDSEWQISLVESLSILAGYLLIAGHYLFPNFDDYLKTQFLEPNRSF